MYDNLKQMCRFASLNHDAYIVADPTPVDAVHVAHAGGPILLTQQVMTTHLKLL